MRIIKRTANNQRRRFFTILLKWFTLIAVFFYLWYFGMFKILFLYVPWLIQYVYARAVEIGIKAFLHETWVWWILTALVCAAALWLEWLLHYRHKRRELSIGGAVEGRVAWIKGVRQGFLYDVWDAGNYIRWRLGRKKDAASRTPPLSNGMVNGSGMPHWPNPWAIPLGPRIYDYYTVLFYQSFWQIRPDVMLVKRETRLDVGFFRYSVSQGRLLRVRAPRDAPFGVQWIYILSHTDSKSFNVAPKEMTELIQQLLGRTKFIVREAIESDPETVKMDYKDGSFRTPTISKKADQFE